MDLIVSTPQGEAEISVNAVHESVTLGDLLDRVLSSPPPAVVYVDGRATPIGALMSASGLVTGSMIDLVAPTEPAGDGEVVLVQAAGEGGGTRRPLPPGRYSVGTARRANVAPLTYNEVLVPRCQLAVEFSRRVTVVANLGDLDGYSAANPTRWGQERLRIGHRVFRLDDVIDDRAATVLATSFGQLSFVRHHRSDTVDAPEPTDRSRAGGRRLRYRRSPEVDTAEPRVTSDKEPAEVAFDVELVNVRQAHPDVAEVVRRATQLSERLWERRPADDDAFLFSVGLADQPRTDIDPEHTHRRDLELLPTAPVVVDFAEQRGIGFACSPPQARAAARALVMQACVTHAPADLDVVVLTTRSGAPRWEWVKWLPHARGPHGAQLFYDDDTIAAWITTKRTIAGVVASIGSLDRRIAPSRLTLVVSDDPALWRGQVALLGGMFAEAQLPIRFVALTDRADDVPAVCTTVVRIATNGAAEVDDLIGGRTIGDVVPFVLEHDLAVAAARKLGPLEDQLGQPSDKAMLPALISLESLLDPDGLDAARIGERWCSARHNHRRGVPLGVSESGTEELDLAEHDAQVLILGAPRSGKTAVLRSIIVSLMASLETSAINLVCVEPSDGSSFGTLAGANHFVGFVDNLDEHRGMRLLRGLRAEVGRRERLLNDCHAVTLAEYDSRGAMPLIPRLAIVVDDAAEVMARDSTFLPQLIDLVDHSRRVGLHLIVAATQLPRSIENSLKAIANVRIGLRMTDPAEATDVIGNRDPVQISFRTPGRGVLRFGSSPGVTVQFASASAALGDLIEVTPFIVARDLNLVERKIAYRTIEAKSDQGGHGTLRLLVDLIAEAAIKQSDGRPRPIVCPELPAELALDQMPAHVVGNPEAGGAAYAMSDLPDDRTQSNRRWSSAEDGNVAIIGGSPKERASALATLLIAASDHYPLDRLHFYVIDSASGHVGSLDPLELLASCGAVATADDFDRVLRVLVHVDAEVERRASLDHAPDDPHIVLVVNDVAWLLRTLEVDGELERGRELVDNIVSNGPANGISVLMTCPTERGLPARMLTRFPQRIILHLDDHGAYRALGIESGRVPAAQSPGRAITTPDLVEIQIASIADVAAAVAKRANRSGAGREPVGIARTPARVLLSEVLMVTGHDDKGWRLPVGLDARTLQPSVLELDRPGGALIVGDRDTGKSSLLVNVARCALSIGGSVEVHAIAATWSPLLLLPGLTSATTLAGIERWAGAFFAETDRARLVLIDDADRLDGAIFERLAELSDPTVTTIAAGRIRDLEIPTHWTAPLRSTESAVILRPLAGDGAMFGLHLAVGPSHLTPGRGVLIARGTAVPILIAAPTDDAEGAAR